MCSGVRHFVTRSYKPLTGVSGLTQKIHARWSMVEGGSVRPLERSPARMGLALAILAILLAVVAGCGYPSTARPACADDILADWTKGALGPTYSAECYEAALEALPEDLRAYTTAADDISRVAVEAGRSDAPARQLVSASIQDESVSALPPAVAFLGALVALVAVSGIAAAIVRRWRAP